jgi:hypothetical protein
METLECVTSETSDGERPDEPSPTRTQEQRRQRGKKRCRETESFSPLTRKIHAMQQQLNDLVKERAMLKKTQALGRHTSWIYVELDLETELDTSDWEDRRMLQAGTGVQKDVNRKELSSKAHSTQTSRPKKRGRG